MAGLSRSVIERRYGLSAATFRSWEENHGSGLTEKGAKRAIFIYRKEQISCTLAWLLEGKGQAPAKLQTILQNKNSLPTDTKEAIEKEIDFFLQNHAEAIVLEIEDDGMLPYYSAGDIVAGRRLYGPNINFLLGEHCIAETKDGLTLCRRLLKGVTDERYTLQCTNLDTTAWRPIQYDLELVSCSPILWHRKNFFKK